VRSVVRASRVRGVHAVARLCCRSVTVVSLKIRFSYQVNILTGNFQRYITPNRLSQILIQLDYMIELSEYSK